MIRLDSGIFNGSVVRRFFMGKGSCFIGFHEVGVGEPKVVWPHHSSCPKQWASIVRSLVPGSEICGWMPALTISIPACWWSMGSSHGAWRKPSSWSTFGTLVWKTAASATSDYINYITKIWKLSCKVNALIFPSFRSGIVFWLLNWCPLECRIQLSTLKWSMASCLFMQQVPHQPHSYG
jgi:hypothetical protein